MIDFPNSPTVGQIFTAEGKSWQWNGSAWVAHSQSSATQVQADWNETDNTQPDFIKNKPTNFTGSNGSVAGTAGFVPAPDSTDNTKFLKGDGSWALPSNFTGGGGSAGKAGFVPAPPAFAGSLWLNGAGSWTSIPQFSNDGDESGAGLVPAANSQSQDKFLRGDATWAAVSSGAPLTNTAPANLADTAAVGTSTEAARADHVHRLPTSVEVQAQQRLTNHTFQIIFPGTPTAIQLNSTHLNKIIRFDCTTPQPNYDVILPPVVDSKPGDRIIFRNLVSDGSIGGVPVQHQLFVRRTATGPILAGLEEGTYHEFMLLGGSLTSGQVTWEIVQQQFIPPSPTEAGRSGLVPVPKAGDGTKFLKGDGSWADTPSATPNSLSIGTVNTGAAGSSASASITGTAPSQTLSLTIPRGDKGDTGNAGTNGTAVLSGSGTPAGTLGAIGDFYINTSTNFIFGPKVNASSWPAGVSLVGNNGADGANGRTILNGTSNPTTADGATGDFYLNTSTNYLWGPKTANTSSNFTAWNSGVYITGNTIFNGTSDPIPQDNLGRDGDFFLNTATGRLFGPRTNGGWGQGVNWAGLRKYGPIAVFQNYNQVFQNSSYNSSSSNGNDDSAFGSNLGGWGFFPVGNFANGFVVNPVDIFGPNAQYRIRVAIRQTGAFNDGLHCTIRRVIIGTGESTVPGLRDFSGTSNQGDAGAGAVEIHSRVSDIITTGATAGWEYYRCYFAAKNGSGATPQDCTITLEQV